MKILEAVLAFNLAALVLWVVLRVLKAAHERQVRMLRKGLEQPGVDALSDELHKELDEVEILGPLWGRKLMAEMRVRVHAYHSGVFTPVDQGE